MTGIEVEVDVGSIELLDRVHRERLVGVGRVGALGVAEVGHQVGQAVGLNHGHDTDIGELCRVNPWSTVIRETKETGVTHWQSGQQ